jgi:cytochrome P450
LGRRNVREHMAFARGVHSCQGAPPARVEGRISMERILDRMAEINVNKDRHGPDGDRRYTYEPTLHPACTQRTTQRHCGR